MGGVLAFFSSYLASFIGGLIFFFFSLLRHGLVELVFFLLGRYHREMQK